MDTDSIIQTFKFVKDNLTSSLNFSDYVGMMGFSVALEDEAICYKMENCVRTIDMSAL